MKVHSIKCKKKKIIKTSEETKWGRRIQMPHENCTDFSKAALKTRRQRRNPFKVLSENNF